MTDDERNLDLAAAVSDINDFIIWRLTAYADQAGGKPEFYFAAVDGVDVEMAATVLDFDVMAHLLEEQIEIWTDEGKITPIDDDDEDDDDPLFTASFDPKKVRPS